MGATQQYYPLLHTAFWVEHRLWGDSVAGYHVVNILLHAAAACLVVALVRRLALPGAYLAGLIFALHPVCVESVAWISEQKNTLSTVFYLGAALVYLRFDQDRRPFRYWLALGLFVLALLTKTVTATLPAALLVVFWWRRGRLDWRRDVWPLLPWLGLGVTAGLFTAWVERTYIGARGADFSLTLLERCLLAGRVIWFYLGKLVWPVDLIFIYPRWNVDAAVWWQYLFPLGVLALVAALVLVIRRRQEPGARAAVAGLAGFLIFAGTLFPASGFINVYPFIFSYVADHFQYQASLGIIVPVAAGLTLAAGRLLDSSVPATRWLSRAGGGLLLASLGVLTWRQCGMYRDAGTLYRETLARNPACGMAHTNLGDLLSRIPGRLPEAIDHFEAALRINPRDVYAHNDLGRAFTKIPGRQSEAIAEYEAALRIDPGCAPAHNNLAWVLQQQGKADEANAHYARAVVLQPDYVTAHYDWGVALLGQGRAAEAIIQLEAAVRLAPDHADALVNLGNALMQVRRAAEAVACYEQALRIKPGADVHYDLGVALAELDRRDEAAAHLRTALTLAPDLPGAHYQLARLAELAGRPADAEREYLETLRLAPDHAPAHAKLGLLLAQSGRLAPAAEHFRAVIRLQPGDADAHANLGNVLLLQGQAREALAQYQEALRLRPDDPRTRDNLELARESLRATQP
jgi:tetratricopeptide (TPR) repeat protein